MKGKTRVIFPNGYIDIAAEHIQYMVHTTAKVNNYRAKSVDFEVGEDGVPYSYMTKVVLNNATIIVNFIRKDMQDEFIKALEVG